MFYALGRRFTVSIMPVDINCSGSGAWGEVAVGVGIVEDGWYNDAGISELLFDGRHVYLRYISKCYAREDVTALTSCDIE